MIFQVSKNKKELELAQMHCMANPSKGIVSSFPLTKFTYIFPVPTIEIVPAKYLAVEGYTLRKHPPHLGLEWRKRLRESKINPSYNNTIKKDNPGIEIYKCMIGFYIKRKKEYII
jgi:hypothetical protein